MSVSGVSPQSVLDGPSSASVDVPAAAEPPPPPAPGLRSRISAYIWSTAPAEEPGASQAAEEPGESTAEAEMSAEAATPGRVARVRDAADAAYERVKSIVSDASPRQRSDSTLNAEKATWLSSVFSSRAEQAAAELAAAGAAAAAAEAAEAAAAAAEDTGGPPSTPSPAPRGLFSVWKQEQRHTEEELQLEQPVALDLPEVSPRKQRPSLFERFRRGSEGAADGLTELKQCVPMVGCLAPRKANGATGKDISK